MKSINIGELKLDDQILAFDANLLIWMKCRVDQIDKYLVNLNIWKEI